MTESRATRWFWVLLSASTGVAAELISANVGHRREAWDSPFYWQVAWPCMLLAAFLIALIERRSIVLVGYAPFAGQLITMVVRTGGGSMLPLGIVFMAIFGVSGVLAAKAGNVV